jgi:hypothetical protein
MLTEYAVYTYCQKYNMTQFIHQNNATCNKLSKFCTSETFRRGNILLQIMILSQTVKSKFCNILFTQTAYTTV